MYNDKNRPSSEVLRPGRSQRVPIGRSCPTFAGYSEGKSDVPQLDERIGKRLCDGSLQGGENGRSDMNGCGGGDGGWGLGSHPLAMVYSPLHEFREIYEPDIALARGTLFAELDLPFEGYKGKKGGCCL